MGNAVREAIGETRAGNRADRGRPTGHHAIRVAGGSGTAWVPSRTQHRRRALDPTREPLPTSPTETPPLPAAYHDALENGLRAIGVGLDDGARTAIEAHVRLLVAWNRAINLTAIEDPAQVALGHVVDSLTAVPVLRARGIDRFVDLGSGGGFPGLPLAAALPATAALLVDSIGKKARFLTTAIDATGLHGSTAVFSGRAETLAADARHRERWPAVTVRAVGALADLVELAFPLLEPGGVMVAWKRGQLPSEVDAARRAVAALGGGGIDSVEAGPPLPGHRLILVTKRGRTGSSYPRDPAARGRTRW